jgi:hypothetical protein
MARDDPFAGLHLSAPAEPGKLEQRLFTDKPKQPEPAPPQTAAPEPTKPPEAPKKPAAASTSPNVSRALRPASLVSSRFDLDEPALYKATFTFTQPELEALEDLKLELQRGLDSKITKYDLMRSALHMLVEDHGANGERSYISRKLRRR